ncbi:MAG: prepilin-type N-terminal cleavage/methylation domain-containing protein [Desulfotignum sp.]|nr:prepilin-type N-terminal cleavage/methylation domain-containing protein [Desulfotignum sp.]
MTGKRPYGFTLVELIVVIALIAILLTVTLPKFDIAGIFKSRTMGAEDLGRWIAMTRHQALKENRDITVHIDDDGSRLWLTHSGMNETDLETTRSDAMMLPGNLRITDMIFAEVFRHGMADFRETGSERIIRFNRNGYADGVILHVTDRGSPMSLKVAPFLMEIETIDRHVSYDDDCP